MRIFIPRVRTRTETPSASTGPASASASAAYNLAGLHTLFVSCRLAHRRVLAEGTVATTTPTLARAVGRAGCRAKAGLPRPPGVANMATHASSPQPHVLGVVCQPGDGGSAKAVHPGPGGDSGGDLRQMRVAPHQVFDEVVVQSGEAPGAESSRPRLNHYSGTFGSQRTSDMSRLILADGLELVGPSEDVSRQSMARLGALRTLLFAATLALTYVA